MSASRRCPDCAIRHAGGRCHPLPMWPLTPLLVKCGGIARLKAALVNKPNGGFPDLISDEQADRWAIRCGFHPNQVWPGWSDAGLTERDRLFIESGGWRRSWLWQQEQADEVAS